MCVMALVSISVLSSFSVPQMESNASEDSQHGEANVASQGDGINDTQLCAFIELRETLPELWNPDNPSSSNMHKRNVALDKLLVVYKEMKPTATRDDARKKLNSLRTNLRKELKKIESSM
ncbi:hypothetical protein PR048_024722 [Dryococelus australis]|uniref:MADF domain-containing protein n=1 Tax=Dryococelus australis TaxID=614101 RepID=A0ABQ9GPC0_9NEOP|nr:hypothetical protein PR048_024722 [Dryococelus australis]